MSWFIRSEVDWLKKHGRQDDSGAWWCKKTGSPINLAIMGRSIHSSDFQLAGSGEVRTVTHLNCNTCYPNKSLPSYGTPIQEEEIAHFG